MQINHSYFSLALRLAACCAAITLSGSLAQAQLVPGTGARVTGWGDDFEDPEWKYFHNGAKASEEQDGQHRLPSGRSANGRMLESMLRGHPDLIKRVPTPDGGLPGSQGSLLIGSRDSGIPGRRTNKSEQDDLIVRQTSISVSQSPSVVVRVYLPPFEEWERRTGSSFGIRTEVIGTRQKQSGGGLFGTSSSTETEPYWPGFFIHLNSSNDPNVPDSAHFIIRSNNRGGDIRGPNITELGWWTLGMSFTPDGQVHYYAHPGIEDLRAEDHLHSAFLYGFRAHTFRTMFFNTFNRYDGQTWSTPWIIDDPMLFVGRRSGR